MIWLVSAIDASACSLIEPPGLALDPSSLDGEPPTTPELVDVRVQRGWIRLDSCADLGFVSITVDRPAGDPDGDEDVGYRFALVDGDPPFALPGEDDLLLGPVLSLVWGDNRALVQDPFWFSVDLFPVDAAGNEGEPLRVEIGDRFPAGCATGPDPRAPFFALLVLLGARRFC